MVTRIWYFDPCAKIGEPAKAAIPILRKRLLEPEIDLFAVVGLGHFGPLAIDAAPRLKQLLANASDAEATTIVRSLWSITRDVEFIVAEAAQRLGPYTHPDSRETAAALLAEIGPPAKDALPALRSMAEDPYHRLRASARKAIAAIER
jgi:hypothetical protein